jgi:hypothetical protein
MAKKVGFKAEADKKPVATSKPAPKKKIKKGLVEIGDTGTRILSGIIREEYNPKLQERRGIDVYDEMRKSDASVRAALLAITLPIRSANWYVEPASEEQADVDIAAFVEDCLFEKLDMTWESLLRQALLSLAFGVMPFEKVYKTDVVDGATRIIFDKIAPRMPRSIQKWAIGDGNDPGITQYKSDGSVVEIPMANLIVFVNEMEGMNWWGTSVLRAAYKHWFIKNTFYKIDAIAFERQGLGIPYVKLPENYTQSDTNAAENILKNLRANSMAYIVEPFDYEIGFKDMMANTTRDPGSSISHHNREILKSVLAQFLELGAGGHGASGSRAVSQDHSRLFLQSLEAVANQVAATFNKGAVKELVDLNFDVQKYPKLMSSGIIEVDVKNLADAYAVLITSAGVQAGNQDEQFFREALGLPQRDPDDIVTPPQAVIDQNKLDQEQNAKNVQMHEHGGKKKAFAEFKPWRRLTFAEEKVNFDGLQAQMDQLETDFDSKTQALLHEARAQYMEAFTKAAHDGDTQAIRDATLKVEADLARIIKQAVTAAFLYGKNNAAKEIGVAAPANPTDMLNQIAIQADAIAAQHIAKIEADSKNAYVNALNHKASITAALGAADAAAQDTIDTVTSDASSVLMAGYINQGRNIVFGLNADNIYGLQRSEILDAQTCNFCESIDGRIVTMDDDLASTDIFHSNCRGIWVAILNDETDKPDITGVPQSLRDKFGNAVNDLVQPKTPIALKKK